MFIIKQYVQNYTQHMYSTCTKTSQKNRSIFMLYIYILYPHIQPSPEVLNGQESHPEKLERRTFFCEATRIFLGDGHPGGTPETNGKPMENQ